MNKWIKENILSLTFILASVALVLLIPSIINISFGNISNYTIINLVSYGLIAASAIVLAFAAKNKSVSKFLIISAALFSASNIVIYVYNITANDSYSAIFYLSLYALFVVLLVCYKANKNDMVKGLLWIVAITIVVLEALAVFTGSLFGAASLIVVALIVLNNYLEEERENTNE